MSIELVVLDWSGTVSDDRRPVYNTGMKLLEHFGKETYSFEEWLPRTTMSIIEFLNNHDIDGNREELFSLYQEFFSREMETGEKPFAYEDARDVFEYLKDRDIEIAVLSSHPEENLIREAKEYGLFDLISLISGSSKNKTEGLQRICYDFKTFSRNALSVGDTIYDIKASKEAGVFSAGICTGYHEKERLKSEKPDYVFECLSEIKNVI